MGETHRSILISNAPMDPKPHFLKKSDVLTIVRDQPEPTIFIDRTRYVSLESLISVDHFSTDRLKLNTTGGLHLGGGFRFHPSTELNATLDWTPALSGFLAVSDGIHQRSYQRFYSYAGGFRLKVFPFYRFKEWKWEPYVIGGYQWTRLLAKSSDDYLKGHTYLGGFGAEKALSSHWAFNIRFLYAHTTYDQIQFLLREGSLNDSIGMSHYSLQTGLSYRFL